MRRKDCLVHPITVEELLKEKITKAATIAGVDVSVLYQEITSTINVSNSNYTTITFMPSGPLIVS